MEGFGGFGEGKRAAGAETANPRKNGSREVDG